MARTTARPKRRCAMKGCGKHTSFYCVKCTTMLNLAHPNAKRPRVYSICSPTVQNGNYCFYQHACGATALANLVVVESETQSALFEPYSVKSSTQPNLHSNDDSNDESTDV